MPKQVKERETIEKFAAITEGRLIFLIAFLLLIILVLMFGVGEIWWPAWIIEYRFRIMGVLILVELILALSAPVIIEADSNPRPLSGPGKNPQLGDDQ